MTKSLSKDKIAVLGLTLFAFAFYAFRLGASCLRGDEAFTAVFSSWPWREIVRHLLTAEPHPPLYHLLIHVWMTLAGKSEVAIRFPSFLSGILLVPLTYALGRQWGHPRVGAWAAALAAINPFLLWQGQDARMYPMLAAFGLGSLLLALKMLGGAAPVPIATVIGYVAVTLGALATHYYALFLVAGENLGFVAALARPPRRWERVRSWLVAQAALLLAFSPWLLLVRGFMLAHSKEWIAAVNLLAFIRRSLLAFSLGTTIDTRYAWPWLIIFALLFAIGLIASWRGGGDANWLLWSSLATPVAATFLISLWRPIFEERYLVAVVPLYLLFVARGLVWLETRWRLSAALIFAFITLASGYSIYGYHYLPRYAKSPDWRGVMNYVAAAQEPGDVLILNYPDPTQEYYNAGRVPYLLLPAAFPVDMADTTSALARLSAEHPRLWLVPVRAENWDSDGLVEGWLDQYADKVEEKPFSGLRLQLYHTAQRYLQAMRPVGAELGGQVRLLGYGLRLDGQSVSPATVVPPGAMLRLKLYWQALARMNVDYTVFTHLLDAGGVMRGQKDSPPLQGKYPTTAWQPGERLVDSYDIKVDAAAPVGVYILEIGMYEWPINKRLPITDAQGRPVGDHLILARIQVGR